MSNPSKSKGTAAETAVVRYLTARGVPAQRVTLSGRFDRGDVHIFGGKLVAEIKSRRAWHSPADIEKWLGELERECMNVPQCSVGVLVVKRPGSGPANAGDWLAYLRADEWLTLSAGITISLYADGLPVPDLAAEWVCVNLAHLASVLAALPAGVLP